MMLRQLYETVKKFSAFFSENSHLSKGLMKSAQTKKVASQDEEVISEVLFRTLSLVCDLNLVLKNYQAAKLAVKDLEML